MKRLVRTLFLAGVLMAALCATAWAAENPSESGIYQIENKTTGTITVEDITGVETTIDGNATTFFAKAEKITLTVPNTDSTVQYLVLALSGNSTTPMESNIVYIDQAQGNGGDLTFIVYPKQLSSGEYHIYVTSSADVETVLANKEAGSFWYYAAYILGCVTVGDNAIDISDVLAILNYMSQKIVFNPTQILAADVTKDGAVDVSDALKILNFMVGKAELN